MRSAVMSNEELYDRMRQQRMLREELRDKKKELEDMMRKEHSLKQNSRNQDTQSDVVSYSNKSDQFGLVFRHFISVFWPFLPARRYASAGYRDRNVSVCPSVRHAPVLCQNEES